MAAGVAWASSQLGRPITEVRELTGGVTSTMLALRDDRGGSAVLRLMTHEPWRTHGAKLTARERAALGTVERTAVPAPRSLALDEEGTATGHPAHLMTVVPGAPLNRPDIAHVRAMAACLAAIHEHRPAVPFRAYQSWAVPAKWFAPPWSRHPELWERAFDVLREPPPEHEPTFLHRDFSHRNLLWTGSDITGVVDWVETSTGPAWLDAGHAATNLAMVFGPDPARAFLAAYAAEVGSAPAAYWLVMDAVGFLAPPGREPVFGSAKELKGLDEWLPEVLGLLP